MSSSRLLVAKGDFFARAGKGIHVGAHGLDGHLVFADFSLERGDCSRLRGEHAGNVIGLWCTCVSAVSTTAPELELRASA